MEINIKVTEEDVKKLVAAHISRITGDALNLDPKTIRFMVKTKANYKAEWEDGQFLVSVFHSFPSP